MNEHIQKKILERRAITIAGILLIANGINFILSLVLGVQTGAWQQFARGGFVLAFGFATVVAILLIRGGRTEAGIWLIISGFLVAIIGTAIFLAGFGLVLGLIEVLIVLFVALLTLPQKKIKWAIGLALTAAVITYSLDLLPLNFRIPAPPTFTNAVPVIAGVVLLIFIVLLLRQAWSGKIRFKLLTVIFIILVVTVFFQTGVALRTVRETIEAAEHQNLKALTQDYNDEIKTQAISSAALSDSFADREDIKHLYLADDREGLLNLLMPIFETLNSEYTIRHLYVENPDGTVYVRIHNPAKFGDDVTYRLTAAAALESQETISGVEIGPSRIGIRSVSPLWYDDKFAGMLEVGLDYDQAFVDTFKARNEADYNLWITYAAAESPGLTPDEDPPKAPTDQVFYYAGTNPLDLPIASEVYDQVLISGEPVTKFVSVDDQDWAVIIAPILGYGDRVIGIIEILTSRTETLAAITRGRLAVLIPAGVLTLAGLVILWFVINQVVLQPVEHLSSVAEMQILGVLSARVKNFPPDEFGDLGRTFNSLSEQLEHTLQTQEQTINNRTRALETTTEVSRRLSTILDPEELVREVVEQVQQAFDYYHTQIYLFDADKEFLILVGGTGEAGQTMLEEGHSVHKGRGLVGRAGNTNLPILVSDVTQANGWLPNPLLPGTRAEAALPIAVGENIIGVLDVQDDEVGGLTEVDVELLQSIANQVASALQNARAYQRSQEQVSRDTLMASINQQIQNTTNVESALQVAVRELGRVLGTATSVSLVRGKSGNGSDRFKGKLLK